MQKLAIYRAGAHFPALDDANLARTAAAYDPFLHDAPLVVGHPAVDAPAHGWVQSLAFSEGLLRAEPRQVDAQLREQVRAGRYAKISASFYRPEAACNPVPGVYYLRHVGFLGAQPPAVKGLPPVSFAEGETEADYATVEFSEAEPWLWRVISRLFQRQREHLIEQTDVETADRILPDYDIQALRDEAERMRAQESPAVPDFAEPPAEPGAQEDPMDAPDAAARQAELDAREAALTQREKAVDGREETLAQRQSADFVEQLVTDGRVLPRDKDALTALLTTVPQDVTVNFAEEDSEVVKPGPAAQFLKQFLSRLPVQVDFAERSAPSDDDTPAAPGMQLPAGYDVDPTRVDVHRRALAFAEKHGTTYDEAVTRIADMEGL